jgi:hypothetical protein
LPDELCRDIQRVPYVIGSVAQFSVAVLTDDAAEQTTGDFKLWI